METLWNELIFPLFTTHLKSYRVAAVPFCFHYLFGHGCLFVRTDDHRSLQLCIHCQTLLSGVHANHVRERQDRHVDDDDIVGGEKGKNPTGSSTNRS
ncbi:hypothetical protein GWI33_021606 [Rhynchophorus ferrugineus]|uniref:Uncharacterized protein n=1 Tax=Rhynchophorus ferrugineus TaxID=354439 RepID=A0A834IRM5_RHYFE|nr:hypothetical protein GWI33_021606 [Rhynchophorus ferrugineus]